MILDDYHIWKNVTNHYSLHRDGWAASIRLVTILANLVC